MERKSLTEAAVSLMQLSEDVKLSEEICTLPLQVHFRLFVQVAPELSLIDAALSQSENATEKLASVETEVALSVLFDSTSGPSLSTTKVLIPSFAGLP